MSDEYSSLESTFRNHASSVARTCSTSLTTLGTSFFIENSCADLETYISDFFSLLTLLHSSSTKLGLILSAPDLAYSAASTILVDMERQINALATCICSIKAYTYGRSLVKELRWAAEDVVRSILSLMESLYVGESTSITQCTSHVGIIHEAINRARQVSRSNIEAVRKVWEVTLAGLEDGVSEVQEMLDGENGIQEEDGWDDIGVPRSGESSSFTEDERDRIKAVHKFLRLSFVMNKKVVSLLGGHSTDWFEVLKTVNHSVLDDAAAESSALLVSSDELISTLYHPQDLDFLRAQTTLFRNHMSGIQVALRKLGIVHNLKHTDDVDIVLSNALSSLSMSRPQDITKDVLDKERRWFEVCFKQVYLAYDAITFGDKDAEIGEASTA